MKVNINISIISAFFHGKNVPPCVASQRATTPSISLLGSEHGPNVTQKSGSSRPPPQGELCKWDIRMFQSLARSQSLRHES